MSANRKPVEHRWGIRMQLDAAAELRTPDGQAIPALLREASLSGAFIETTMRVPLQSRLLVRPVANDGEWLEASVVRRDPAGLAVEWMDPGLHPVYVLLSTQHANGQVFAAAI